MKKALKTIIAPQKAKLQILTTKFTGLYAFFFITLLSISAWYFFYSRNLVLAYNDAMSHLNLSRLVIDNIDPGLTQIGGVWLPLTHVLPLTLIWNEWAWQSGFAGSLFSMLAYLVSSFGIYQIIKILTQNKLSATVGAAAFALNLNMLYLQSTPMTESLYIAFFVLSALFFVKYTQKNDTKFLILLGITGFLQVLTRYDGWFVVGLQSLAVILYELFVHRKSLSETFGKTVLFAFPVAFGIALWLTWNLIIFKDPFFFALGPYSAHAQQLSIESASGLFTKYNIYNSTVAFIFAAIANIGLSLIALALGGIALFFINSEKKLIKYKKAIIIFFLAGPIIFNILALFLGFSILNLPELNWNPSDDPAGRWFNVRYGVLALPFIAIFIGIFANWKKLATVIALEIILLQIILMYPNNIITITDGTIGSSSYQYADTSDNLRQSIDDNDTILLSLSFYNPVAFKSGAQLKQIVHEGTGALWTQALTSPEKSKVDWIVMSNGSIGEPAYSTLITTQKSRFLKYYVLHHKGKHADIYQLKPNSLVTSQN